jgi:hypothetical protein
VLVNWDNGAAEPDRYTRRLNDVERRNGEARSCLRISRNWMGRLPYTRMIAGDGSATAFPDFQAPGVARYKRRNRSVPLKPIAACLCRDAPSRQSREQIF